MLGAVGETTPSPYSNSGRDLGRLTWEGVRAAHRIGPNSNLLRRGYVRARACWLSVVDGT
jgi:hypothetical protein